jgi:hypothetical protein
MFHSTQGKQRVLQQVLLESVASIDWTDESEPYRSPLYAEVDDSWRPKGTKVTKDETSWTATDVKLSKTTLHYMHTIVTETTWGPE